MANTFTIDSLRSEIEDKYAPVVVELTDETTVELKPLVRVGEKDRKVILSTLDSIGDLADDDDEDSEEDLDELSDLITEEVQKILRIVCNKPKKLFEALQHDDSRIQADLHTSILMRWTGQTQLGEAASSSS